jgi:outer membrane putative beta-barrel porin/alpha-amylase
MNHVPLKTTALGVLCATRLFAAEPSETAPDKSQYHLFKPTPRELMREMSTDRPDQTESAYTVDAGHFQVEMDFVSAVFDRDRSGGGDVRTEVWGLTPLNLKLGLLNNVDVQFVLDTYVHSRVEDRVAGTVDKASGFGDLQTRLKINLWGNDGGKTALAIMPFVKLPLSASSLRNGKTEGGVIIPLAVELPHGWSTTVMTEFDFVADDTGGYDTEFVNSITFAHDIIGNLGGYVEFFSVVSTARDSKWQGQADVGFTYAINDNTVIDFGCNFGVTKSAPDFNPFVGLSWRF